MINNVLGIVNFEHDDVNISGLSFHRAIPVVSLLGRYRFIDFTLSNMTNSGIQSIHIYTKRSARAIFEHVGRGSQYNINPKKGKLLVLTSDSKMPNEIYNHDVAYLSENLRFIKETQKEYVIISPSYFIYSIDYSKALAHHIESGNEVTVVCKTSDECKEEFLGCNLVNVDANDKITDFTKNSGKYKKRHVSLECYIMKLTTLERLLKQASETSELYWLSDVIADECKLETVGAYFVKNDVFCINSLRSYVRANLIMKNPKINASVFKDHWPILTKTSDSIPTFYGENANVRNSFIANGCKIDGEVDNCVIGRNVVIGKGAIIKNSVILANSKITKDAYLENVVVDKDASVEKVKDLRGEIDNPVYVKKLGRV